MVGLGASAATYYPKIGEILSTRTLLPAAGGVANAIGAVVGHVVIRRSVTVTVPSDGVFVVHLPDENLRETSEAAARERAEKALRAYLEQEAARSGADAIDLSLIWEERRSQIEGRDMLVEATLHGEATGRPRTAQSTGQS